MALLKIRVKVVQRKWANVGSANGALWWGRYKLYEFRVRMALQDVMPYNSSHVTSNNVKCTPG